MLPRSIEAMRLVTDMIEYCDERDAALAPRVSISGYHIREAGSTAAAGARVHAQGRLHLRGAGDRARPRRGRPSPRGCRSSSTAHIDFFEEIAKYRAARRIWAREMRDTYGAKDQKSMADAHPLADGGCVAHGPAAAQQHHPDRHRGARRGVLGRHPVSAHQQPTTRRWRCPPSRPCASALRTQQIIAEETGRDQHHRSARRLLLRSRRSPTQMEARRPTPTSTKIDELGGMVEGGEAELSRSARSPMRAFELPAPRWTPASASWWESTSYTEGDDGQSPETLRIDAALERKQIDRLQGGQARRGTG